MNNKTFVLRIKIPPSWQDIDFVAPSLQAAKLRAEAIYGKGMVMGFVRSY